MAAISNTTSTPQISPQQDQIDGEVLAIIKENGGPLNQRKKNTLLFHAIREEKPLRIHTLLSMGADPNSRTFEGNTAFHYAILECREEATKILFQHPGTDPTLQNNKGNTALHLAAGFPGNSELFRLLLNDGRINPNLRGEFDNTALHFAAGYGRLGNVQVLCQDPRIDFPQNNKGLMVLKDIERQFLDPAWIKLRLCYLECHETIRKVFIVKQRAFLVLSWEEKKGSQLGSVPIPLIQNIADRIDYPLLENPYDDDDDGYDSFDSLNCGGPKYDTPYDPYDSDQF